MEEGGFPLSVTRSGEKKKWRSAHGRFLVFHEISKRRRFVVTGSRFLHRASMFPDPRRISWRVHAASYSSHRGKRNDGDRYLIKFLFRHRVQALG